MTFWQKLCYLFSSKDWYIVDMKQRDYSNDIMILKYDRNDPTDFKVEWHSKSYSGGNDIRTYHKDFVRFKEYFPVECKNYTSRQHLTQTVKGT